MSLPQHIWDIIRNDPRYRAASHSAQRLFIRAAAKATWDIGHENARKAAAIFDKALTDAFGPSPYAMNGRKRHDRSIT